jgi:tripartite-type tricarboxylate transporter receptor subunit TctC
VLQQPALRQRLAAIGVEPLDGTQEQFDRFFRAEVAKWSKVVVDAGIKSE